MTSKFKCPVCQNNLHKINMVVSTCTNDKCKLWGSSIPNLVLKALTQARLDLEIATKALQIIANAEDNIINTDWCGGSMRANARIALKQIEHKDKNNG